MGFDSMNGLLAFTAADLKSTDYFIAVTMAYFIIKELLKIISKKSDPDQSKDQIGIEHRRQMMNQNEKIMEGLQGTVSALQTIKAISQSTNNKVDIIKDDMILVKDRILNN